MLLITCVLHAKRKTSELVVVSRFINKRCLNLVWKNSLWLTFACNRSAVHCVILNTDPCGCQGHMGIRQLWKQVPCCPGRVLPMSHECWYRVTSSEVMESGGHVPSVTKRGRYATIVFCLSHRQSKVHPCVIVSVLPSLPRWQCRCLWF